MWWGKAWALEVFLMPRAALVLCWGTTNKPQYFRLLVCPAVKYRYNHPGVVVRIKKDQLCVLVRCLVTGGSSSAPNIGEEF